MTINEIDKKFTKDQLIAALRDIGVNNTSTDGLTLKHDNTYKRDLVLTYLAHFDRPEPGSNVSIKRGITRVLIDGKDCSNTYDHTIALRVDPTREGGLVLLRDNEEVEEDTERFHTTFADIRAALLALEADAAGLNPGVKDAD